MLEAGVVMDCFAFLATAEASGFVTAMCVGPVESMNMWWMVHLCGTHFTILLQFVGHASVHRPHQLAVLELHLREVPPNLV